MKRLAAILAIGIGSAHAEPTEINRIQPSDGKICRTDQEIIVVRCLDGTNITCGHPGSVADYVCQRGRPVPTETATAKPAVIVKREVVRVPAPSGRHYARVHHAHIRSIFDLLFRTPRRQGR